MTVAIILAGGSGTRMHQDIPKQFIAVNGRPIILYTLEIFHNHPSIDVIAIVAPSVWQPQIEQWLVAEGMIGKLIGFAETGSSRQHSVLNGLIKVREIGSADDIVIIHDAVRPSVSARLILRCIESIGGVDGVMPALQMKDTVYKSFDGKHIGAPLSRDELFAGQTPEAFILDKYYLAHQNMTENELSKIRGSSELAVLKNLRVRMIDGEESNYKITTPLDLERFRRQVESQGNGVML